jgi:hypothetical protein
MAKTKRKSYHKKPGSKSRYKKNPGTRKSYGGAKHKTTYRRRRSNPGMGSVGDYVTNATFAIVGAFGSKLGAQLLMGTNNTGVMGYLGNIGVGAGLWFVAAHVMKNREAAKGIATGTMIQVMLRALNDYTPVGAYLGQLGMGDYQAQSYTQPQILVDPTTNADIRIPSGWGQAAIAAPPMAAVAAKGMNGFSVYDTMGGGGGTY